MSDTAIRRSRGFRNPFSRALAAGPLRLAGIAGVAVALIGTIAWATMHEKTVSPESRTARQPPVNTLPGGTNSTPYQDRLAVVANQQQATRAQEAGQSFTPPIAASQRNPATGLVLPDPVTPPGAVTAPPSPPFTAPVPAPQARHAPATPPVLFASGPPASTASPQGPIRTVAQTGTTSPQADDPAFRAAVNNLFGGWQGRPAQTTVTLVPSSASAGEADPDGHPRSAAAAPLARRMADDGRSSRDATEAASEGRAATSRQGRLLMPAGRGLYAHTVLAVNSETGGPIVLQADSGPLAGARLIGSFSTAGQSNRLVVRVDRVQFQGRSIQAEAIVVAPDTMETAVATSVDQRVLERFVLPGAAAFIAGIGQAVATTSNSYTQLGALGGASVITRLNPEQQLAVGAGVAAQQVGRALQQAAPRGPTIHLAANAPVGIMFLNDLRAED
ncbi:MAG: TrbI/VirB10 family protein [Roseomonas mucosa]|uniref:DotG/IcmE/VirB10 family protein n=3 Tax=Roseomonas mucosa TaxID=207340 RepID=UPI001EF6715A|nr:DotG/IcmE/VirB10 family protein [Roseomonas mucosa]MCG7354696.1 type IV secretion protein DotG [Roseomonas mucosa]MDU7519797.1 TrbI/VirB10 family protein [Roseomonas mucosa]